MRHLRLRWTVSKTRRRLRGAIHEARSALLYLRPWQLLRRWLFGEDE